MSRAFGVHGFRTVLGRRILGVFFVCVAVPVTLMAVDSYRRIQAQLDRQAGSQIRTVTRSAGMAILDRLQVAEAELELLAEHVERPLPAAGRSPNRLLEAAAIVRPDGTTDAVLGDGDALPRSPAEVTDGARYLFSVDVEPDGRPIFLLGRRLVTGPDPGTLWARLDPDSLVASALLHADTPPGFSLCVQPLKGSRPWCPDGAPADAVADALRDVAAGRTGGRFTLDLGDGREALGGFWDLFMRARYGVPPWTLVALAERDELMAPGEEFRWMFPRIALVALALVLLLSHDQIRRNLRPLATLRDAARRFGEGTLDARAEVQSDDEFGALAGAFNGMAGQIERQLLSLESLRQLDRAVLGDPRSETVVDAVLDRAATIVGADVVVLWLPHTGVEGVAHVAAATGGRTRERIRLERSDLTLEPGTAHSVVPAALTRAIADQASKVEEFMTIRVGAVSDGGTVALLVVGSGDAGPFPTAARASALQLSDQIALALSTADLVARLEDAEAGALTALARSVDLVSPWTAGHAERVAAVSIALARTLELPDADVERVRKGALLHDIGKIGIPPALLDATRELSPVEIEAARGHVRLGVRVLEPIGGFGDILPIIEQHHERFDGGGYPAGLADQEIDPLARIVAVANAFDRLTSDGPSQGGLTAGEAFRMIREQAGSAYDPAVVDALGAVLALDAPTAA